jgi:hypothetical protein
MAKIELFPGTYWPNIPGLYTSTKNGYTVLSKKQFNSLQNSPLFEHCADIIKDGMALWYSFSPAEKNAWHNMKQFTFQFKDWRHPFPVDDVNAFISWYLAAEYSKSISNGRLSLFYDDVGNTPDVVYPEFIPNDYFTHNHIQIISQDRVWNATLNLSNIQIYSGTTPYFEITASWYHPLKGPDDFKYFFFRLFPGVTPVSFMLFSSEKLEKSFDVPEDYWRLQIGAWPFMNQLSEGVPYPSDKQFKIIGSLSNAYYDSTFKLYKNDKINATLYAIGTTGFFYRIGTYRVTVK